MSMIKFVRLPKTVVVTINGKSYSVSNSHPLYEQVIKAIDDNELGQLETIIEHNDRHDFLGRLKIRSK
jgi:hypothetical protein